MNADNKANFSYLSDGGWAAFQWQGLEQTEDGSLRLHQLPLFESELPEGLADGLPPDGPAGIATDSDGTIYFSDPSGDRIRKIEGCFGEASDVACMGGRGSAPAQFNSPRGLLIAKHRRSLFVADSRNHRVQVFDLRSLGLVDVWGQREVAGVPQPGSDDGLFNTPVALAADSYGNVYVVDYGNSRVQKFNRAGEVVPSFWQAIEQTGALGKPCDIAVYSDQQTTRVFILDEALHEVFVFDAEGEPVRDRWDNPVSFGSPLLKMPLGIAAGGGVVYVGDNELRRVLTFKRREDDGYEYAGTAVNYKGTVAALAFDTAGDLLVHTGTSLAPLRLATKRGYAVRGVLWSNPIRLRNFKVSWHRLQAVFESLAQGAHLRLFVHTSNIESSAPAVHPDDNNPFADPKWRPRSDGPDEFSDISDLFIGGEPAAFLWVGALFSGDGLSTPIVSQMRVEFDHDDYRQHLPAIYRDESPCGDFLSRFLSMFESFFGEVELEVENLSRLFDTAAAPAQFLPWLASWLALELDEDWSENEKRRRIATAFESYSRRGTVAGLRESLLAFAGVSAIIEEPILNSAWWAMPAADEPCGCKKSNSRSKEKAWGATENSILGVTTMLAPAEAQGAVLGTTTTLGGSHLITNEEYGAPLFEDVANQFSVQIYRGQLGCAETLAQVREVIESEKPAHTSYHLCIIEPRLRVGFQARVGVDAVVAGPPLPIALGESSKLGSDAAIGGELRGSVGERGLLGVTTHVG